MNEAAQVANVDDAAGGEIVAATWVAIRIDSDLSDRCRGGQALYPSLDNTVQAGFAQPKADVDGCGGHAEEDRGGEDEVGDEPAAPVGEGGRLLARDFRHGDAAQDAAGEPDEQDHEPGENGPEVADMRGFD